MRQTAVDEGLIEWLEGFAEDNDITLDEAVEYAIITLYLLESNRKRRLGRQH